MKKLFFIAIIIGSELIRAIVAEESLNDYIDNGYCIIILKELN